MDLKELVYKRCDSKIAHRSMRIAERLAERASMKKGELIIAYRCIDCGSFHIGHADLSQRLARAPHVDLPCQHCGATIPEFKKWKAEVFQSRALYCSDRCQKVAADRRRVRRKHAAERQS